MYEIFRVPQPPGTDGRTHAGTSRKQYAPSTFPKLGHKNYELKAISIQPIMGKSVRVLV